MRTDAERADDLFEQALTYADDAASLGNAAGYNVAIQTLKWAAVILNPTKYGKPVTDGQGNVAGYIIETGIRRTGDAGFESGTIHNEQSEGENGGVPFENGAVGGQNDSHGMDLE